MSYQSESSRSALEVTVSRNHNPISDLHPHIPGVAKMVSMTKFDGSGTTESWLCILEEEIT